MAFGPGKYDELCSYVREDAAAAGVIVIVLDGKNGSGFSCQASIEITVQLPKMLRDIANQIDQSFANFSAEVRF